MADAFYPETGSVFIGGVDYTFKVRSFNEEGGEKKPTFIKTMNRRHRTFITPIPPFSVSFDMLLNSTDLRDLHNTVGSVGSISLDFPSYQIDYFNMYNVNLTHNAEATGYVQAKMSFECATYDSNGSENRVIS